jgi:hypothetical protein
MRTDDNNNPMAFTTDVARYAGLTEGVDFEGGTPFPPPSQLVTAKLLGDPIAITIRMIDAIGFYTHHSVQRWVYMALPKFVWDSLSGDQKRDVIGFAYQREGGIEMRSLFPNYGKL